MIAAAAMASRRSMMLLSLMAIRRVAPGHGHAGARGHALHGSRHREWRKGERNGDEKSEQRSRCGQDRAPPAHIMVRRSFLSMDFTREAAPDA
jgi:hypothetical protein